MLQPILGFFIRGKNVKKFVRLQTLKVTCTCAWKNYAAEWGKLFLLISKQQP